MKFDFEISKLAFQDINDIWEYTAKQWSKQQANKYYNEIFQAINEVCKNPELGKSIDQVKPGHHKLNVKSHMIIYKAGEDIIYVDRILHQKMYIEKHLND